MNKQILQIPSDGEERQIVNRLKEHYQSKIFQSHNMLLKTFDAIVNVIKSTMQGTQQQKTARINKRLIQLYDDQMKQQGNNSNYCQKREPNYGQANNQVYPVLNTIIIYGTDWWPARKIKQSLKLKYIDFQVQKLDSSHTKIAFNTPKDALDWLKGLAQQPQLLNQKIQEDDEDLDQQHRLNNKWKGWIKLKPYQFMPKIKHKREARFATNQQYNIKANMPEQNQYRIRMIKQKVAKKILSEYQAQQKYQRLIDRKKAIESQCHKKKRKSKKNYKHNKTFNASRDYYDPNNKSQDYSKRSLRERSRDKNNVGNSMFFEHKNEEFNNDNHYRIELPSQNVSNMSYSFLLSEGQKNQKQDMSFSLAKQFDQKLNMVEDKIWDENISMQVENKNDELSDLLKKSQKMDEAQIAEMSFHDKIHKKKANPAFSYAKYMEEQEKQDENIIQI